MSDHVAHRLHQPERAAAIEMPLRLFQDRPEIERFIKIAAVMMDHHLAAEFRTGEFVAERRDLLAARAVVKLELGVHRRFSDGGSLKESA